MGYSISDELKTKYLAREPQICNILVSFLDRTMQPGSVSGIVLTEDDIVSSGLNIDRALFTGNKIEVGTAISTEATVTLNNTDGRFNEYHFEGAKLEVYIGLRYDGQSNTGRNTTAESVKNSKGEKVYKIKNAIPMGTFYVDNCPRRLKKITLTCLDHFAKLDVPIPKSGHGLTSNVAVYSMISAIFTRLGYDLLLYKGTYSSFSLYLASKFSNYNVSVPLPEIDGNITYRGLFQYLLQILGGYAFMDWDGNVRIEKFGASSAQTIGKGDRYSSDIHESSIEISGVQVTYKDGDNETTDTEGSTNYAISVAGNPLITSSNHTNVALNIYNNIFGGTNNSLEYTPFTVKCKPMLWLYPLDEVTIIGQDDSDIISYVTNTNFTLNGTMVIESKGETSYEKGWASSSAFTAQQTSIIEGIARQDTSDLRQKYQDVLNLNDALAKSMGLWRKQINGIYYYYSVYASSETVTDYNSSVSHSQPPVTKCDLSYSGHEGKDTIYMFGSGGIGWGTSFNSSVTSSNRGSLSESEVIAKVAWKYGVDNNGNAVLHRIRADMIKAGLLSSVDNNTYFDLTNSEICTTGSKDGNSFKTYFRGGDIEFYGSTSGGQMGKTAKMRTGYQTSGDTTTKHFALGYISNDNSHATDGSSSLKLGAFATSDDHFIDLLEISGSSGAVFGTSSAKINAYIQGGHIETNVLKTSGEYVTEGNAFSTGLKHYSAHSFTESGVTYEGWRQHYFGSYISQNKRHWTGWQTYGSDGQFQQSFTSILYDNAEKDTNIFRISNPKYTVYVNFAGGQNVIFAKAYSAWNQNLGLLNLYCDDVKLSNGTSSPTSVKTQLSSLWENKAGTDVYTTLSDKAYSLSSLESDAGSTWGAFQIITKPDDNGNRETCCSINANTSHVVSFKHFYGSNNYCTIEAAKFDVKSVEDIKKNISSAQTDALSLLKNSVIYNYDYIDEDEGETTEITTPISIDDNGSSEGGESGTGESEEEGETLGSNLGFVIGRETPEEVISEDGTAVNLYSFTSLTWLACQQLLERIKTLEARVDELENPS